MGRVVGAIINRPQNDTPDTSYVELSEYGKMVDKAINEISFRYENVSVDRYVIMPNHIHLILEISNDESGGRLMRAINNRPYNISVVVKQLKRYVTKQLGFSLWQKSFYDHIIRDEQDYSRIAEYIETNPVKWAEDIYYLPG